MFGCLQNLWTTLTCFADRVSQKVLSFLGKDRRSCKLATEKQIASQAHAELARIGGTDYATNMQAEIALQGYRTLYQQITLPEVRQELPGPSGLSIVRVGGVWRIMDQAEVHTLRANHGSHKAGRRHPRRVVLLASAAR